MKRNMMILFFALVLTVSCFANEVLAEQPRFYVPGGASNLYLGHIRMNRSYLNDSSGTSGRSLYILTAFVPTNSDSRSCLATLNGASNHSLIESVYCEYLPNNPYGNGLNVVVKFQWDILTPYDDNWCGVRSSVTFLQDGATYYGEPVFNGDNLADIEDCQ